MHRFDLPFANFTEQFDDTKTGGTRKKPRPTFAQRQE